MLKSVLLALNLCLLPSAAMAQLHSIIPLPSSKVADMTGVELVRLDGIEYPTKTSNSYSVRCQAFHGRDRYFIEVSVTNKTTVPVSLFPGNISFEKPEFISEREDVTEVAREYAIAAGQPFVPQSAPYIPPTVTTTVTTSGNTVTARSTVHDSGQAQANLATSLSNMAGAHAQHKAQAMELSFADFLMNHRQTTQDGPLQPEESRTVINVFKLYKMKKSSFAIHVSVGNELFNFTLKD